MRRGRRAVERHEQKLRQNLRATGLGNTSRGLWLEGNGRLSQSHLKMAPAFIANALIASLRLV